MKRFSILLAALFICTLFALYSCDVVDDANNGTGQITVHLTDAPGDYDAVYIDIQSVRIKSDNFEATENNKEDEDGWLVINDEPARVDLLELRNGNTLQLGSEELDAGTYHQIRLVLGSDNNIVVDGESYPLTTPSAQQSGLKLNIDATIEGGEIYNLLIDFDAGRSIVETGSGKYLLKPVLRAVNLEETGKINGTVDPDHIQTSVIAIAGNDTLSTLTGDDGKFSIMGVPTGTYDVMFRPQNETYSDTTVTNVTVESETDAMMETIKLKQN